MHSLIHMAGPLCTYSFTREIALISKDEVLNTINDIFVLLVNPLTGDLIGAFGSNLNIIDDRDSSKESSPAPENTTPTKSKRIPPGGHSTPLW